MSRKMGRRLGYGHREYKMEVFGRTFRTDFLKYFFALAFIAAVRIAVLVLIWRLVRGDHFLALLAQFLSSKPAIPPIEQYQSYFYTAIWVYLVFELLDLLTKLLRANKALNR